MRNKIIFLLVVLGVAGRARQRLRLRRAEQAAAPGLHARRPIPTRRASTPTGSSRATSRTARTSNIYPEVAGSIVRILVAEGQQVTQGTPLVQIDDSIQRATAEQQKSQAEAAQALLEELRAQPRKENLEVARAQVEMAQATLKTAQDTLDKQQRSYKLDPESVSKDALDNAINAQKVAKANLEVVTRQYELTKAGAWVFDVRNQEKQAEALAKAYAASSALLAKYTVKAPSDGIVLSINATVGSYVSPQGAYDTYTQGFDPVVVMGTSKGTLDVRCYIDEILIPRLPPPDKMQAQMSIRGTTTKIPLEFVRLQPYVSPKIELSNQRLEKVDLRVLPVIFRFQPPAGAQVYPGEMVDVYIGEK